MAHYLVIHEKGEDWSIEHEEMCPQIKTYDAPFGPIVEHDCLIGRIVRSDGIDDHLTYVSGGGWRDLEQGKYEIKSWEWRGTDFYGGHSEYEAGIEFVDKDDQE